MGTGTAEEVRQLPQQTRVAHCCVCVRSEFRDVTMWSDLRKRETCVEQSDFSVVTLQAFYEGHIFLKLHRLFCFFCGVTPLHTRRRGRFYISIWFPNKKLF